MKKTIFLAVILVNLIPTLVQSQNHFLDGCTQQCKEHNLKSKQIKTKSNSNDQVKYTNISPKAIKENEEFMFFIDFSDVLVDSIIVTGFYMNPQASSSQLLLNGSKINELTLCDNGKNGDVLANDGIYSIGGLTWEWPDQIKEGTAFPVNFFILSAKLEVLKNNTSSILEFQSYPISIMYIRDSDITPVINILNDSIQYSDYVINYKIDQRFCDPISTNSFRNRDYSFISDNFCDDNHDLIISTHHPYPNPFANAFHTIRNNEVEGICLSQRQNDFPADGLTVYAWGSVNSSLYVHEYLHQYAAFCDDLPFVSNDFHWNNLGLPSSGFFGQGSFDYKDEGSGKISGIIYNSEPRMYNSLELYLMGHASIDDIEWPLKSANINGTCFDENGRRFWNGSIDEVTKQEFLDVTGGIRTPSTGIDTLKTSMIVFSNEFLSPNEMAFYENQMIYFENNKLDVEFGNANIYSASQGKMNHITKLRRKRIVNEKITICEGENYNGLTESGTYEESLTCDLTTIIELEVLPNINYYTDIDNDGYGDDNLVILTCNQPNMTVLIGGDCDDNNSNINPDQTEVPYNGSDDDCNSATPDDDLDQDGFLLGDDCDDNNPNINPDQDEEPYNGIDDDCNSATLDDDLDQDGFLLADDCDDNNPNINPDQAEEPYNGIDDDCNSATLDDDLDQDGFLLADDCDDNNPNINPNAEEIPNNGIDEDCDGNDLMTSTHEIANSTINIFPNPAIDIINIAVDGQLNYNVSLYDLKGKLIKTSINSSQLNLEPFPQGTYLLQIKDLKTGQKIVERIVIGK